MRARFVLSAVCLSVTVALGVSGSSSVAVAATAGVQDFAAEKAWVRHLAMNDPRSIVRIAAWQAVLSKAPEAAIRQFMDSGYAYAVRLSEEKKARNTDFVKWVLATYPAEFSPAVHAAAQKAMNSPDDAERERFAHGGFEAAKQRDRTARETTGKQARALAEADRQFVRDLAAHDPGEQVRVSASYAVRVGATDSDVVDFFASGWAFGAKLDLDTHRRRSADNEMRWRAALSRLLSDAAAAEQAARDASGDQAERAKSAAVRAWQAVGEQTGPARSYWGEAQRLADKQAANWATVLAAANAGSGPNWAAMTGPARDNQAEWTDESTQAAQQARYWAGLLQQAEDGEQRVRAAV
ncbi:hypothetical protein ATK36_0332 [Amycolatopsis sulphurea]|uniref:Uncharacterized protein n=1 Tax=Amycolatopsis sulphurea TaxID=76022 RepID=A0A2A9G0W4_9PSEU|nr:hypothetical protein [Amycolatopsis sulphurea]PFG56803.1 hypothetical protein ATK36_0332 [Amycolatopsis sulphurea]